MASIRAYVPLRKKRKAAGDAEEESDAVAPYALPNGPGVHASGGCGASGAIDVAQEATWTRLEHGIAVDGDDAPPAVNSFEAMRLPQAAVQVLHSRGITTPTAIQMQAIPSILSGRDVIGLAATGSGKSLCFLLPLLTFLEQQRQRQQQQRQRQQQQRQRQQQQQQHGHMATPLALIVVPTRELMEQIFHELRLFAEPPPNADSGGQWIVHGAMFTALGVCGGVALHDHATQIRESHAPIDVVVATPGRLLHLIERSAISLQNLRYLVMDEVDRMLSVEMEPQLREILRHSNAVKRQTLLWSATMPHFLDRLARSAVLNPIIVRVGMGSQHTGTTSSLHVTQRVVFMRAAEKKTKLLQVLRAIPRPPVLVFCNSHESVDFVTRVLLHEQFHVASLHGDKSQAYRFQVLAAFRDGYVDVLVATDLASRGLDFADVEHVIIFDMPHTIEDYVHRCGRTGRTRRLEHQQASSAQEDDRIPGVVTAFLTIDCEIATELLQLLRETKQQIPAELQVPGRFHQRHHA